MSKIGYARVSTTDQDTALQVAALRAAGCAVIREEKASGTSVAGRPELATVLEFLRSGDLLVVTRIDRLARSIADLQTIVRAIRDKGAALQATEQPIDTTTAAGKMFLDLLGVFAEFETALRRERQLEGIAKAKTAGVYRGRKPWIDPAQVRALRDEGVGPAEIARRLGIGRASVYRLLSEDQAPAIETVAQVVNTVLAARDVIRGAACD
jgi:DNA invertase Pin-like site-specific DNA recombinase